MDKIPSWLMALFAFLAMTPLAPVVKEVQKDLADGKISISEAGDIAAIAALNAQSLYPGDPPEEQLAVDVTEAIAKYLRVKFPPESA